MFGFVAVVECNTVIQQGCGSWIAGQFHVSISCVNFLCQFLVAYISLVLHGSVKMDCVYY